MSISKADDIAKAITARVQTIRVEAGFHTDIGVRVYRGKTNVAEQDLPCAVLVEADDRVRDYKRREVKLLQRYIIEAGAPCDVDNPNDTAHKMIADVKRALFGGDVTFGGLVRELIYEGRAILPRERGSAFVGAVVEIDCEIHEDLANP